MLLGHINLCQTVKLLWVSHTNWLVFMAMDEWLPELPTVTLMTEWAPVIKNPTTFFYLEHLFMFITCKVMPLAHLQASHCVSCIMYMCEHGCLPRWRENSFPTHPTHPIYIPSPISTPTRCIECGNYYEVLKILPSHYLCVFNVIHGWQQRSQAKGFAVERPQATASTSPETQLMTWS